MGFKLCVAETHPERPRDVWSDSRYAQEYSIGHFHDSDFQTSSCDSNEFGENFPRNSVEPLESGSATESTSRPVIQGCARSPKLPQQQKDISATNTTASTGCYRK